MNETHQQVDTIICAALHEGSYVQYMGAAKIENMGCGNVSAEVSLFTSYDVSWNTIRAVWLCTVLHDGMYSLQFHLAGMQRAFSGR